MADNTSLGDRIKMYEDLGSSMKQLLPLVPAIIRLDGKNFHTFTRGLAKPFEMRLIDMMQKLTQFLVEETNAKIGYTQSDEITLVLSSERFESLIYFDGRTSKINSVLASKASVYFNSLLPTMLPAKVDACPVFDCRCFVVPNETEAVNCLIWREQDAVRNSIQMVGQANFSHKQLHEKSCPEIQEMLWQEKQINWNDFPTACKRGTYVQRYKVSRPFTVDELEKLPPLHAARSNPALIVERSEIRMLDMPILTKVLNARNVVFRGETPFVDQKALEEWTQAELQRLLKEQQPKPERG